MSEALQRSRKVAVGNYVFKQHEHLGVIKPHGNLLVLNQLRYNTEIVNPKGLIIPKEASLPKKEVEVALKLIDHLTKPFNPARYTDTYVDEIHTIIKQKAKGKKVKIKKTKVVKSHKVHDIMGLLKESLQQHQKKGKKRKAA